MKTKIFSIVLFLTLFTLVAQVPSYVPTNGLVAYYPFNGNANDVSSNGNNGTVNGATLSTDRNGMTNSAYSFNGTSSFITVPNNATFNFQNQFTFSYWINAASLSGLQMSLILSKQINFGTDQNGFNSNLDVGALNNFRIQNGTSNPAFSLNSPTNSIAINTWYHIVQTWNGSQGTIYINGVLTAQNTSSAILGNTSADLLIGKANWVAGNVKVFNGKIDDIGIWNRALTAQEIANLYNPCAIPPSAPIAADSQTFCATPAPTVASLSATGTSIQWYDAATAGNLVASTATLTNGQVLYASQTVASCESTTRTAVTVTLNDPQITASATTVCSGTAVSLSASTTATLAQNCNLPTTLQNGLVGYWPFCGNANDTSGNNNNGTVNGATLTADRFGNNNGAYSFDGTSSYIEALNPLGNLTSNFTISSYVKINDWDGGLFVHLGIDQNGTPRNGFGYGYGGTQSVFPGQNYLGLVSNVSWYPSGYQFSNLNQWYHTAVVRTNNNLLFYINGINVGTATIAAIQNPTNSLWFGCGSANYALLNGNIDDVAIFNRALSASEVSQLYTPGTTYLWSTGETTATINPTPTATTTYWCDVTVNGVTCRKNITINVNSTTPAPTGAATQTFCATPAPTVANLTATGTGIQWYDAATGGNVVANTATLTNGQVLYASQTVASCESTTRTAVTVTLNDPQITASATTVCSGTAVSLSAASTTANPLTCNLPTNLQNGLVGYWPFCGNANDASGNNNNGTVNGATLTADRFGNTNSAYSFDGVNDYIISPSNNIPSTGIFTVSFWIKMNSFYNQINDNVEFIDLGSPADTKWGIASNNQGAGRMNYGKGCLDTGGNSLNSLFVLNSWNHYVFRTNNTQTEIFKNGILAGTTSNGSFGTCTTNNLYFGTDIFSNQENTNMLLDDVMIWNSSKTDAEIIQLYNVNQTTYLWSTGETTATINPTPTATTTYWCDVTVNGVTCRKEVIITVNSTTSPVATASQTFCATPAPTVASLTATGTGIQWYDAATGGNVVASTATLTNGQIVYASQTVASCESTTRAAVTVTLNDPQITASATTVCSGTAVNLSASTTLNPLTCNLPTNLQNGLVGYWPFCGNANDASGNNNNGTVNGATLTTDRFGNANSAYNFDGVSNYISVPNIASSGNQARSMFVWVNYNSTGSYHCVISTGNPSTCNTFNLFANMNNSNGNIGVMGFNPCDFYSATNNMNNGQWHYIGAVYDGQGNLKTYLDGLLFSSSSLSFNTFGQNNYFGLNNHNMSAHYLGILDDIIIYNRALSPTEITQLYNTNQTTYFWSTGETTASINPTPTATTTYWCDVTVNGVTCRKNITINVNSTTPAPTGAATQTFCATPAPTVASLSATGTSIQWYDAATGGNVVASTATLTNGQIVYASQTVAGCESTTRAAVTVTLNDPQITASTTTVCSGTAVSLTAASATANPLTCSLPTNLQNGLVGYWPFCGNANDLSGNGNNGTIGNGIIQTIDRNGLQNSAFEFNGNGNINLINLPTTGNENFTISSWIKTNNLTVRKGIACWGQDVPWASNYFFITNTGYLKFDCASNGGPQSQTFVADGNWHNVAVTNNNGTIRLYIDGYSNSNATQLSPNIFGPNKAIGANIDNSGENNFIGALDDIAIYNRALSPSEIAQLYTPATTYLWSTGETTATINPTPTATTTYWCDVTVNGVTCRKEVTITVNSTTSPVATASQTFCATPAPTVASLTATGTGIQWYDAATGGNVVASTATLTNGQIVYASQTVAGCESTTRAAVTVTLNDPQITASTTTVCSGTAVSLTAASATANPLTCNLPTNLQNGLVGYWPFCGNANDASGNNNNGTVNGATLTTDRFGNADSAYNFDGVNDFVNLLNSLPDLSNFTITGWFYHTKGSSYSGIFSDATIDSGNDLYFNMNNNSIGIKADKSGSSLFNCPLPEVGISSNPIISSLNIGNDWEFITVTVNQNECKIYLNGIYLQTINQGGSNVGFHALSPSIGRISDQGYNIQYFQGKIDDFIIYNRVLNQSEITQLYTPAPTYLWSTGETTATINPTPTATTTYWCDVTVNGVTCRKEIEITVNPTPALPTVTTPVTYCQNATATALTASGTDLLWYTTASGGTGSATTPTPVTSTAGTTSYYVSQTLLGCEGPRAIIDVVVNPTPALPTVTTPVTYCQNATATALTATGTDLLWYTTASGGTGSATAPTPVTTTAGTTTYYVSQTLLGCEGPRAIIDVVVNTTPSPTGAATQTFCATPAPTVANLTATGTGIQWYDAATGGTLLANTGTLTNGQVVYASQTVAGCESTTRTAVTVTLNDPQITASATTVCIGSPVTLTASTTVLPITTNSTLPTNLQNGLIGYWPFNGNANDESGNNNNGTVNGAIISSDRFGTSNNSYSFNRNIQNEINVVNSTSLNSISNITISLWVKLSSYGASNQSGYNHYINKSDQNNNHQFVFANNNTELYFYFSGGGNYFPTNNLPPLNQWTNIIVTYQYDGTIQNSFCKFYINGNLVDSILTTQALNYSNYDIRIGNFGNSFYNRLDGQLDDIVIWNRALNSNEIQQLYSGTSYAWSTGETTATINPTPTATTTYWCDVTVNGVTCRKEIEITVNTTPAPTVITPVTYCQNSVAAPLTATGANFMWYTDATGGTGTSTAPTPDTTTPGSTTWYVSQSVAGCESTREAIVINVTPSPAPPLVTTPLVYCQNSSAIPLAATGTNLLWYTAPNAGIGSATAPTPSTSAAGSTFYYVSQTVFGCESPRETIEVSITPTPPTPAVTSPLNYCQYSNAVPLAASGTDLLWYTASIGGSGSTVVPTPVTTFPGVRNYFVSQTISGCESPRAAIEVTITAVPFPPAVTNQVNYCQNSIATPLTATGTNLLWYTTATGGTGSATAPTPDTATAGITNYYVSQTVAGCEGSRATIIVRVIATPIAPPVLTPVTFCQYSTTSPLNALGPNLLWYTDPNLGTGSITAPTPDTETAGTTTYYVSQSISGCEGPRSAIEVIISAAPSEPIVTTPVSYCQNSVALPLTATGTNLLWYTAATGGTGVVLAPTPITTITGNTTYYVSQTVSGCESLRTAINVIINAAPLEPTGNSSQYFCANIYPTIQDLILNQNSINWYSSATSSTALTPSTPLIPNTIYYAEQFDITTGCQSLTRLAVTVFIINENAPTIVDDLTFCEADEKTIEDINTNGAIVIWYDTPTGGTPLSSNYVLVNSQVLYAATYNSTSGCESLDRQSVTITTFDCEVKVNNLLTLDGNNLNDNLNIINIESFPANEIEIYNRYGQVVWRIENYNNTTNTFKGRANVGGVYQINDNLPTGTYYYVLKYYNPHRNKYEVTKSYLYISNTN
jgi:hypothetical protein